jgi:hypothetical protein
MMLNLSPRTINGLCIEGGRKDGKLPKGPKDGDIVMAKDGDIVMAINGIMLGCPGSANVWKAMNEFGDIIHPLKPLCKESPETGKCRSVSITLR